MGLVNTGIKSTPCVQWNILLYFWCCGPIFLWRSWTSCLDTWHHGFYQIPTDKKSISDWLVINLIMGHVGIFQPTIIQTQTSKTTQKWVTEHKTKLLLWSFLSSEPCRKWVRWTEEKKLWIWRIWRDSGWRNGLWSLVRCSLTSSAL